MLGELVNGAPVILENDLFATRDFRPPRWGTMLSCGAWNDLRTLLGFVIYLFFHLVKGEKESLGKIVVAPRKKSRECFFRVAPLCVLIAAAFEGFKNTKSFLVCFFRHS